MRLVWDRTGCIWSLLGRKQKFAYFGVFMRPFRWPSMSPYQRPTRDIATQRGKPCKIRSAHTIPELWWCFVLDLFNHGAALVLCSAPLIRGLIKCGGLAPVPAERGGGRPRRRAAARNAKIAGRFPA